VVEEGLEWGPAKRRAVRQLGCRSAPLPDNDQLEEAVREYIELFCGDTQPQELQALRELALVWMDRLRSFARIWPERSGAARPRGCRTSICSCSAMTPSLPK
jgi:hypothetical protein